MNVPGRLHARLLENKDIYLYLSTLLSFEMFMNRYISLKNIWGLATNTINWEFWRNVVRTSDPLEIISWSPSGMLSLPDMQVEGI